MKVATELRAKVGRSRDTLVALFTGALSLMFTQTLVSYLNSKLYDFNVFGVDPPVFELVLIGAVLVLLVWFGIVKRPQG